MNRRELISVIAALGAGQLLTRLAEAADSSLPDAPGTRVFNEAQRQRVAQLAEIILPATDTSGAIAAGVPAFIERMVGEWYTPAERRSFLDGLQELDRSCTSRFGAHFDACSEQQRTAVLAELDEQAHAYQHRGGRIFDAPDENAPFFLKLKQLTVVGFYTSQIGATQELSYNPVPNRYDGDIEFAAAGGRQWSF